MTDKNTLDLARQWAADIDADRETLSQDTIDAAADLISSLPDAWVDADELREIADEMANWLLAPNLTVQEERNHLVALLDHFTDRVHNLLIDSAGTTTNEIEQDDRVSVDTLRDFISEWRTDCPTGDGYKILDQLESLLPAPPAPEPSSPRPEDVPVGEPWEVEVYGKAAIGYRNDPAANLPWTLVCQDKPWFDYPSDDDVTLVTRLVPETTEQDDKQVLDPAYTYRDKDGDNWGYRAGRWDCLNRTGGAMPIGMNPPAKYGPYTRIEALQ